jgi:hypothetical protein
MDSRPEGDVAIDVESLLSDSIESSKRFEKALNPLPV